MKARLNYLRTSPRKVRQVVDVIRSKDVAEALDYLSVCPKEVAQPIQKLLQSAIANAKNLYKDVKEDNLKIKKLIVEAGPSYSRYRARAHGRAAPIKRRQSTVILELEFIKSMSKADQLKKVDQKTEIETVDKEKIKEADQEKEDKDKQATQDREEKLKKDKGSRLGAIKRMFRRKTG